jgi:DNA primase
VTAIELIQYIIDNNLIQKITDDLGCHGFKIYSTEYRCGLPGHKNKTSIAIKKDSLKTRIFQADSGVIKGDIITLVMHIKNLSFVEANKYLHQILGIKYQYKKNKKNKDKNDNQDPLEIFKKIKRKRNCVNIEDIEIYDDTIIEEYEPVLYIDWVKEDGIMEFTRKRFNIGYSYKNKRIVIPVRYWAGEEDDYVGIIGRTTVKNYDLFDIPKYYPLKPYLKGINLYGLQENYKSIQEAGYCVILESEKGVLKRHSRLDETVIAIGSHNLSDEQVKILIGINCDLIIAYDKDISLQHIRSECERFYGIRNVYYIYDKYDLLGEKDSPSDAPNKIYNYLLKNKIKYDEIEHKEYLKELERAKK